MGILALLLLILSVHLSEGHFYHSINILASSNVSNSCVNGTYWIYTYFGECVLTSLQYAAFIIGLFSILFWIFAQLPQLIQNCRTGKADVALSALFLLQWLGGDLTNLIGAFLTGQLPTQIATAIYFVIMDAILLTQYTYYFVKNKKNSSKGYRRLRPATPLYIVILCGGTFLFANNFLSINFHTPKAVNILPGRTLLSTDGYVVDTGSWEDIVGYVIGCISALLYLGSRIPQIVKNFRRKSTDGLSLPMFIMAVMGNLTYGLGILLYSVETIFLLRKLPWLVGSIGTLCFDFTIFIQFIIFGLWRKTKAKSGIEGGDKSSFLQNSGKNHYHSIQ
ncbi:hypothetical protein LOD99_3325 [Oopsacas minuta]|uniref:Uncharacterized protein n=1 Tax=Oopsacas minuta TaxID=111878 RepID=A0AAV7JY41_9METZ|nr:hypothetical protein LOD99_3325 [Oopsacas minuta]